MYVGLAWRGGHGKKGLPNREIQCNVRINPMTAPGVPGGTSGKESICQCRRCKRSGFDPWVRKNPWSRKWQPSPVFLPGKFHGQRSLVSYSSWGGRELNATEPLGPAHSNDWSRLTFQLLHPQLPICDSPSRLNAPQAFFQLPAFGPALPTASLFLVLFQPHFRPQMLFL